MNLVTNIPLIGTSPLVKYHYGCVILLVTRSYPYGISLAINSHAVVFPLGCVECASSARYGSIREPFTLSSYTEPNCANILL